MSTANSNNLSNDPADSSAIPSGVQTTSLDSNMVAEPSSTTNGDVAPTFVTPAATGTPENEWRTRARELLEAESRSREAMRDTITSSPPRSARAPVGTAPALTDHTHPDNIAERTAQRQLVLLDRQIQQDFQLSGLQTNPTLPHLQGITSESTAYVPFQYDPRTTAQGVYTPETTGVHQPAVTATRAAEFNHQPMNEGSTHIGHVAPLHGTGGAEARYNPFIWNNSATIAQQQYQVGSNNPTYALPAGPLSMNMTNVADYGTPVDNDGTAQTNAPGIPTHFGTKDQMMALINKLNADLQASQTANQRANNAPMRVTLTEQRCNKAVTISITKDGFFDGNTPASGRTGPPIHEWQIEMKAVCVGLGLDKAIMNEDNDAYMQKMAAFTLMQGLTQRMRTAICKQPSLTNNGSQLWVYLDSVYSPQGIAGLLYCMSLTRLAKPARVNGNVTPDEVRAYIERCRSLWLLSSRQICKDITWGTKIEMLFRALDDDWCQQFRFALTERIQNKISTAATGTHAEYSEHVGEALIEYTISEMLTFVATHSAQIATSGKRPIAEVNYTDKGGKGKGGGKGGKARIRLENTNERPRTRRVLCKRDGRTEGSETRVPRRQGLLTLRGKEPLQLRPRVQRQKGRYRNADRIRHLQRIRL